MRGPKLPGWNFAVELTTEVLRNQLQAAFTMNIVEARRFLDAIVLESPARLKVQIEESQQSPVRGRWLLPRDVEPVATLLYLHGGGYAFYPKPAYDNFVSEIAVAAKCRTFLLDYRLAPEYRFPAQLEDAIAAYKWLLNIGTDPERFAIAGDSAGGNLALALALALRDHGLPRPAVIIPLSPPTEFNTVRESVFDNKDYDWIDLWMLARFAGWFCEPEQTSDPRVSPVRADLSHLPPTYIQAGAREILIDGVRFFAESAKSQGAEVTLETWEDMNHCFQCFGQYAPQSVQAIARIAEVIHLHIGSRVPTCPACEAKSALSDYSP